MTRQIIVRSGLTGDVKTGRSKDGADTLPVNSQNPYWLMVTFPYQNNDTFDRGLMTSPPQSGFRVVSRSEDELYTRAAFPLLFDLEIKSWQVSQTKSNHIHNLNVQMFNTNNNLSLLEWLNGGDWCMFWAFSSRQSYEQIRRRLIRAHGALAWTQEWTQDDNASDTSNNVTDWMSGLKFIGRLQSPRHHEYRSPDGTYDVGYDMQAFGFTELESSIYYDDVIRFKYPDAIQFYQDLGLSLEKFLVAEDGPRKGFVNTNVAIPALAQILLGKGPGVLTKDRGNTQMRPSSQRASIEDSPNVQFDVPGSVARILNPSFATHPEAGRYYADILTQIVGDQTYGSTPKENTPGVLTPDVTRDAGGSSIFYTSNPLIDYFPPNPLDFKNKSVWSILKNYVNEPINEIYTALRPHPTHGRLTPTIVVRRTPYSSDTYQSQDNALKALPFSQVPRWVIPESLMNGYDIGKTDTARINYVHVTPSVMPSSDTNSNEQLVRLQSPPVVNKADIIKHGLRTFITPVAGYANPTAESQDANVSRQYTEFMADIVMDAHLRYSGTLTTVGIQEPVQPGDNLVFNGILFHIEGVHHGGGIDGAGSKTFQTSFSLSHGIPLKVIKDIQVESPISKQATQTLVNMVKKSRSKHKNGKKQKDSEKIKNEIDRIEDFLRKYHEPPEDSIRKLRNDREELSLTGLVGAHTHHERF